jgi:nitroreductase
MRRRQLLGFLTIAAAMPQVAFADVRTISLDKAFPYLVAYLQMPSAERSHFYLAFRAYRDKHPVGDAAAAIVAANGARTPIAFDRQGIVTRVPDLATLKGGGHVEITGAPFQMVPELRCTMPPSVRIDVSQLAAALAQVNNAVAKFAGALSLVIPKFTAAYFPDAGAAQAVMADGRTATLPAFSFPSVGPVAYIEPAMLAGARTIVFARAPSRILLGGHPKS